MTDSEYVCDLCGEAFDSPAKLGGHKNSHQNTIPDADLLDDLRAVTEEVGRPATEYDLLEHGSFAPKTYRRAFGSIPEARSNAGFEKHPYGKHSYKKSEIQNAIQNLASDLGRPPTTAEMDSHGPVSMTAVQSKYDSWENALEDAEIGYSGCSSENRSDSRKPVPGPKKLEQSEVLEAITNLSNKLGRPPTTTEIKESDTISMGPIYSHFETYYDAVDAAGFSPDEVPDKWDTRDSVTKHQLLENIDNAAEELGRPPKRSEITSFSNVSVGPYYTIFGTWGNALREAGYEPPKRWEVSKETLVDAIQRLSKQLGRAPTYQEFDENKAYSASTVENRFGSWVGGVSAAGLEPIKAARGKRHPNWQGGHDEYLRYGAGWTEAVRREVRERDGYNCQDPGCELTQSQHLDLYDSKLHVHHIRDPEKFQNKEDAHDRSNLISLCAVHHGKWEHLQPLAPQRPTNKQ